MSPETGPNSVAEPNTVVDVVTPNLVPEEARGPAPVGTLMVVAVLLLVTIAFWCLVLGIQQGRA